MTFATLSRFRPGRLVGAPPAWAGALSVTVLCAAALLVLATWVVAAQLDPGLTGSWRWAAGVHSLA